MPRSVRLAVGLACALGLIGAASTAVWIADALADGAATRWLSIALDLRGDAVALAASPLYLVAFAMVPIALRRDGSKARVAFQLALLASITLGVMASGLVSTALAARRLDGALAGMLVVLALVALLAGSLSRPSARAWFAPAR
jgi:hypothetical protein